MRNLIPLLVVLFSGCQAEEPVGAKSEPPKLELKQPQPIVPQLDEPEHVTQDLRDKTERIHQLRELETRKMQVNGHNLTLWIMDDNSKRAEGMMWLENKDVKDTEGMLFVFGSSEPRSFWMQNCPLSLDISYIDSKGKVLNTVVGKPFNESGLPSKGSAQYVLELKAGCAKKFGIKPGSILKLPKDVKSKE